MRYCFATPSTRMAVVMGWILESLYANAQAIQLVGSPLIWIPWILFCLVILIGVIARYSVLFQNDVALWYGLSNFEIKPHIGARLASDSASEKGSMGSVMPNELVLRAPNDICPYVAGTTRQCTFKFFSGW